MKVIDPFAMGMSIAYRFWNFLLKEYREDVEQVIRLATLKVDATKNLAEFDRTVARELYALAKANGWRKPHCQDKIKRENKGWYRLHINLIERKNYR